VSESSIGFFVNECEFEMNGAFASGLKDAFDVFDLRLKMSIGNEIQGKGRAGRGVSGVTKVKGPSMSTDSFLIGK
jgi:hypothetical protein